MLKQLIINADDFGLSSGTNAAIISCHQAGSVTSTTLMVNMPGAEEAAELARANPQLGVGLHFTLTLGRPVSAPDGVLSLVDSRGHFYPREKVEKYAFLGKIKSVEIARELQAQINKFKELGLTPTHIDSHQHMHMLPGIFDVVAEFCVTHQLPLRIPWVWPYSSGLTVKKRLRQRILKSLIKRHLARWSGGLKINQGLASVFDLGVHPDVITSETYLQLLQHNSASPLELMVHPARVDDQHRALTSISSVSDREYAVLSSCNLGQIATEIGYEVTHFGKLFAGEVNR